jgi:hypothetical protein
LKQYDDEYTGALTARDIFDDDLVQERYFDDIAEYDARDNFDTAEGYNARDVDADIEELALRMFSPAMRPHSRHRPNNPSRFKNLFGRDLDLIEEFLEAREDKLNSQTTPPAPSKPKNKNKHKGKKHHHHKKGGKKRHHKKPAAAGSANAAPGVGGAGGAGATPAGPAPAA